MFLLSLLIILLFLIAYLIWARKFNNPYKLILIFAKKGVGKTTYLYYLAQKFKKRGITVYSNFELPDTRVFDIKDFGKFKFPEDSVVLIDEVNLFWDNRDFKAMPKEVLHYFRKQRKYKNTIYLCSQTFDCDKKIRNLTDEMWLLQKYANTITIGKRITKIMAIRQATDQDADSQIVENLEFAPFFIPGNRIHLFLPKYIGKFASFDTYDQLDFMPWSLH